MSDDQNPGRNPRATRRQPPRVPEILHRDGVADGAAARRPRRAIAEALVKAKRPSVIWLSFQECTGCTESLTRSHSPTLESMIFDMISLDYHHTLQAASGYGRGKIARGCDEGNLRQISADGRRLDPAEGRRRLFHHRRAHQPRPAAGSRQGRGGDHRGRHLRRVRRHPQCQSESDRRGRGVRHHQGQTHHQHLRLPADPGGDHRRAGALPHLRRAARTGRTGPSQVLLRRDHPRPLLSPPVLRPGQVRQDLRRRRRAQRLVPVRTGLQGADHPQRLRHDQMERRHQLPDRVGARLPRLFGTAFLGCGQFLQRAVDAGQSAEIWPPARRWRARQRAWR